MELKEFIESGILELYVLDALDARERDQVHGMAREYPEVLQEIAAIEKSMESFAQAGSIQPPAGSYDTISKQLEFSDDRHAVLHEEETEHRAAIIPMYPVKFYAYALAACFTLLLVSTYGMYNLWSELKVERTKYNELAAQSKTYGNQVAYLNGELGKSRIVMQNPDFKKLALNGTASHSNTKAVVWWNTKKHTVMIDPEGLPNTDADHSYQLWAIVKGKPVDAGVFDLKGDLKAVSQLKDVESAQAFAITLEPRGGSKNPTLSEMYVMASI